MRFYSILTSITCHLKSRTESPDDYLGSLSKTSGEILCSLAVLTIESHFTTEFDYNGINQLSSMRFPMTKLGVNIFNSISLSNLELN